MRAPGSSSRRFRPVVPFAAFLLTIAIHIIWNLAFPERDPRQSEWVDIGSPGLRDSLAAYVRSGNFWMGFSYALPVAFAASAFRRYREERNSGSRAFAFGGLTFSGGLAVAGCFLLGCCGSPMLAVYLSLFGAGFLPFARPFVALFSLVSVGAAWWWLEKRTQAASSCACGPTDCGSP